MQTETLGGELSVRWMTRNDLDDVLAIDSQSFLHPWTEKDLIDVLRNRNVISSVALKGKERRVVGFMVYGLHKKSRFDILRLAVHPDHRFQGVGRKLIDDLAGKFSFGMRNKIRADVTETNLDAQLWLQSLGFICESVLYGEPCGEDVYRMIYRKEWGDL
jgi:ribosomal protein S18 acetylase RimI-like enzyme